MKNTNLYLLPFLMIAAACSSTGGTHGSYDFRTAPPEEARKRGIHPNSLSREMAWLRSRQVGKVSYTLWFGLDEANETYEGRVVVHFELKDLKKTLPADVLQSLQEVSRIVALDFEGGEIHSLAINGTPVNLSEKSPYFHARYDGHRIYFHSSELTAPGANRIQIAFAQRYSTQGDGFHRFKDPADGNVYVYTNSEPYDAHRIFPCFDQPDLKASYELTAETPPEWQVIANTAERDVSTVDGRQSWAFPPSPVFSTYLFELAAGPYASWKSQADGMPLRLFARQSVKKYVDADEWFDTTRRGLEYYSGYFGYPYPYAKYDQIIVPEFNAGAMENVSAITFSERFAPRTRMTPAQRRGRASTILHEMAHQWFGDLVTMRWWNGLWLNESFATYMASRALNEATDFKGSWQHFQDSKSGAQWEDQLVTTHPIEVPVPDTEAAGANFDGITYGKGAAVLQQLNFYLGDDDFREGLQRYFMRYALRNTTINEFMRMLSEGSGKDLSKWQKSWLQSAGVNGLRADWACDADGKISKFSLHQSPATEGSPELRTHRTRIGVYDAKGSGPARLRAKGTVDVEYSAADTPVAELIGKPCPTFVYPNEDDRDYARVELDPASLEYAAANLSKFESPFTRQIIWGTLHQRVIDGKMKPQDYFDAFLSQGATERDPDVLSILLDEVMPTHPTRREMLRYLPSQMRAEYLKKLEAQALKSLKSAPAGRALQRLWFDAFVEISHSPDNLGYARRLFDGKARLSGFPIEQSERWDLITLFGREGDSDAPALVDAEFKNDPSDLGVRAALKARVSLRDGGSKAKWLQYFLAPLDKKVQLADNGIPLSPSRLRAAIGAYYSVMDEAPTHQAVDSYFAALPKLREMADNPYSSWFAQELYPGLCDGSIVERTSAALDTIQGLPISTIKWLKVGRQEEQRCIRAQAMAVGVASDGATVRP